MTTQAVYDAFLGEYADFKTFFHGHSYTGNALGCSAAIANLEVIEKEKVLEKIQPKIKRLSEFLKPLWALEPVGDIRQCGLMVGIELVKCRNRKEPYPLTEKMGFRVARAAKRMGMLIRPLGNVIVLLPPLSTSPAQLSRMVRILQASIREATA